VLLSLWWRRHFSTWLALYAGLEGATQEAPAAAAVGCLAAAAAAALCDILEVHPQVTK
jgi:hypothetical protein